MCLKAFCHSCGKFLLTEEKAKEYTNLKGTHNVIVTKLKREENKFVVDFSTKGIVVKQSPKEKFVEIVTDHQEF